ncbi:ATP-binding cassette domain-containing protein [Myxococcus xanthus]|uniref:ABC transporter ATP-binding protein n=1 Tax=Myxococcus xanthus TaxID=34 RepID=UPI0019170F10|nr:ABC transporter transmembrane domain-containing protein [Myxococcus xanthus]QQR42548.1 ATP-binding cassette domain-containing protein [Myxococcus xanthus]
MGLIQNPPLSHASLRRVLALARPEWRLLLLGTCFLFIGSAGGLLFPQAIRVILDEALTTATLDMVNDTTLWMLGVCFIQSVAIGLRFAFFNIAGERIVSNLRERLYRSLLEQEIAFFDQHRTGGLTSRLSTDTALIQGAVSTHIAIMLRNATTLIGGLALLLYTSPRLTLVMLAVVPPVTLGALFYGRKARQLARDAQAAVAEANEVAAESLYGIQTVQAFVAEDAERRSYGRAIGKALALARTRIVSSGFFMGGTGFTGLASTLLVFWYGTHMVVSGDITVGGLTSFLMYTLMVVMAVGALSELWAEFMKAGGATERVFELIDRTPAISVSGGERPANMEGHLRFRDVSFSYPTRRDVPVLQGLDLDVAPGEVVALVGHSGAGKSTVASMLMRFYDPDRGAILVDETDLRTLDVRWLRQNIGIVSQEPTLFSGSIADNIRYGRTDATDAEVEAAARVANAHDFVSRFPEGYRTRVGERGIQLSGGQKQRVAIARAVLKDPRLLILDEATSALDSESEHLVKEALDRLMVGRTTLIIAHRLSTVAGVDRIFVLDQGRVVQHGNHEALITQDGLYKRLVERQFIAA